MQEITSVADSPERPSVHLASLGGTTGRATNSFVFGNAPAGAAQVKVTLDDGGTSVVHSGLFIVALRQRDVVPGALHWTFLAPDGTILLQGDGLLG